MTRKNHKYEREHLAKVVAESLSFMEVLRKYNKRPVGGNVTNLNLVCRRFKIDTSHMLGQARARGQRSKHRKSADERLVLGTELDRRTLAHILRKALDDKNIPYQCVECGNNGCWQDRPLTLEINHKDGRYWNNTLENLEYLCPNCHSQYKPLP